MAVHSCESINSFCYVCARFQKVKQRNPIDDTYKDLYKKAFKVKKLKNLNKPFTPSVICDTCKRNLAAHDKKGVPLRFKRPAIWCTPQKDDCYCCLAKQRYERIKPKEHAVKYSGLRTANVFLPRYKTLPDESADDKEISESDSDSE